MWHADAAGCECAMHQRQKPRWLHAEHHLQDRRAGYFRQEFNEL
jgi:hypothetical protein